MRKQKIVPFGVMIRSGNVGSILANLFRVIMADIGIVTEERYDSLMARYIRRAEAMPDGKRIAALRQGLSVELLKASISWKTFMRGLEFLAVKEFTLIAHLTHRNSHVTAHVISSKILGDKDAGTCLSNLLQRAFFDLGIAGSAYEEKMEAYIDRSSASMHKRQRAAMRSAVGKDLLKDNITWKTFSKGMIFIGISKVTLELMLTHQVKKEVTRHVVSAEIDDLDVNDDGNQDD